MTNHIESGARIPSHCEESFCPRRPTHVVEDRLAGCFFLCRSHAAPFEARRVISRLEQLDDCLGVRIFIGTHGNPADREVVLIPSSEAHKVAGLVGVSDTNVVVVVHDVVTRREVALRSAKCAFPGCWCAVVRVAKTKAQARNEANLCRDCGETPPHKANARCLDCLNAFAARRRANRQAALSAKAAAIRGKS